jgi:PAS domain S-box-containing protein
VNQQEESSIDAPQDRFTMEDRFALLVHSVVDYAIYMLDTDGYITSWNKGAQQIKGYSAHEVMGPHFSIFYTDEDRAAGAPAKALSVARAEGRFNGEAWRVRRDGSRFLALVAIDAVHNRQGNLIGFAKITRDITERRETVARLEESERRFRLFVEGVPDVAICMLDVCGRVRHWNAGARRLCGYDSEDIIGEPFATLFAESSRKAELVDKLLCEAAGAGIREVEHQGLRKDGSCFVAHTSLRALKDTGGELHGYAFIIRDLSERRATENELLATREQLLQSQKLDALGQLTGGVAHDFNNILQAITGGIEMASLRLARGESDKVQYHLDSAVQSVQRAMHLTRRLLAFARRQPLMPSCVDLNELVTSMADLLERTVGARIGVDIKPGPANLYVFCDASQLETVLLSLAINGRDAMPQGGRLSISTQLANSDTDGKDYARLVVSDNGSGMSRETMARAFEPFFTTKPQGQGTGLGLSMIDGFVRQSSGAIHMESTLGEGTRVEILLPACEPPSPVPAA